MMRMQVSIVGAGHVGELLPGQRQRNERPAAVGAAHLGLELQEQPRETWLDAAAGQLGQPVGQLDQPCRQAEQQTADQRGVGLEQPEERRAGG
jgi:hypothetical protein